MSDYISLTERDKAVLERAAQMSLSKQDRVYVDAAVGMGTSCEHITLFALRISDEYNLCSTIAVFEDGVRL